MILKTLLPQKPTHERGGHEEQLAEWLQDGADYHRSEHSKKSETGASLR